MKRVGKTLLVIACVIGIAVGGIRLVMDRQVGKKVHTAGRGGRRCAGAGGGRHL